jgi:hypothetical protein
MYEFKIEDHSKIIENTILGDYDVDRRNEEMTLQCWATTNIQKATLMLRNEIM